MNFEYGTGVAAFSGAEGRDGDGGLYFVCSIILSNINTDFFLFRGEVLIKGFSMAFGEFDFGEFDFDLDSNSEGELMRDGLDDSLGVSGSLVVFSAKLCIFIANVDLFLSALLLPVEVELICCGDEVLAVDDDGSDDGDCLLSCSTLGGIRLSEMGCVSGLSDPRKHRSNCFFQLSYCSYYRMKSTDV